MKFPDLGSSGPHQTPMPATEPTLPFPLQAPSLYTTSHSLSSSERERFLTVETTREGSQLLVDASAFETSGGGTPRAKNSASSKVLNFLYLALGKYLTCSSQSDLETFNWTRIYFSGRYIPSFKYPNLPPSTDGVETPCRLSFCGHIQLNELSWTDYKRRAE
jgi:hypothetical protein